MASAESYVNEVLVLNLSCHLYPVSVFVVLTPTPSPETEVSS